MNYILTGGAGFIGSHLLKRLTDNGDFVYVLDDLSSGNLLNLEECDNYSLIEDYRKLPENIDGVFHLGMPSSSPMYKERPECLSDLVHDGLLLLEYCRGNGVPIVYASTSSVYNGNPTPWREDMPIHVTDYYTEARYYLERLVKLYHGFYGVSNIGLRLFSVYGENERYKGKYANLVSQFIWDISAGRSPIIYGDGTQSRDFIYQYDVVDTFIQAVGKVRATNLSEIYNVGTGTCYSLLDLVAIINGVLDSNISPKFVNNPIKNYIGSTLANTEKAHSGLGWSSTVELPNGIEKIISKLENEVS